MKTRSRVRVGFIGCGRHATRMLYPSLRLTELELVVTSSLVEEEAIRNARLFGAERHVVGHEALLERASDLDAVLIAVGPPAYRETIEAALSVGLPVWAEKPAAASAAEAGELRSLAEAAGVPLCVGFMKRFAPAYERAKEALERGVLGPPRFFSGKFAMGAGIYPDEYTFLVDNSIHMVDLMHFFMGSAESLSVERSAGENDRVAFATLARFSDGSVGTLHLSTFQSWRAHNERVEITGDGCSVIVDNVIRYQLVGEDGLSEMWEPNFTVPIDENQTLVLTGYARELQHFAEVVRDGVEPRATIVDAEHALRVIDAIYEQAGGELTPGARAAEW